MHIHFPHGLVLLLSLLLSALHAQGQTFETLFSVNEGGNPYGSLIQGSDGSFYGTTYSGGASDYGTVFKITSSGTHTLLHSFNYSNGGNPEAGLVLGSDGSFYGTTQQGGASGYGTVYKITASGTHTLLYSFASTNGSNPNARLVQGSDGSFYGTTSTGGASNNGTVFKITTGGTHTVLHSFNNTNGRYPQGGLAQGSDGSFYGTTQQGGATNSGTVFKITSSGTHTLLHSFNNTNGRYPQAGLFQGSDGSFYGTTQQGGASSSGTVFKISSSGTHTLLHSFNNTNGGHPRVGLVQGSDDSFYGTTSGGGVSDRGTVFKITASGTHTLLHSFNGTNGGYPSAELVQGSDGSFYGTSTYGGTSAIGTVFKITASGTHTLLHTFNGAYGADGADGAYPRAGLVLGTDGSFYGTTESGGASDKGTVFKVSSSGIHTVLHSFNGANGRSPWAGLVQGTDGSFYGTTSYGGASDHGTVFQITPAGIYTLLRSFDGTDGASPRSLLVQGSDGNFYGTTREGGASDKGTVFKITRSGIHTLLHSFDGSNGSFPYAGLVQGSDGSFYGTTVSGGASNNGTVFKITARGTHTLLHSFNSIHGRNPHGELVQGSDGSFYGTTNEGGASDGGTAFKITAVGTHTLLHHFDGPNGSYPFAGLVKSIDGNFYGTTTAGGASGNGTVYQITISGNSVTHTPLHSFDGITSANPHGKPIFGTDGSLYGTANQMCVWRLWFVDPTVLYSKGGAVPGAGVMGSGIPVGAVWNKLGVPAMGEGGQMALLGEWKVGSALGSGVFYQASSSSALGLLRAKGAAVPGVTNAVFSAFKDPLVAEDGAVVWHSTLGNAPGTTGAVKSSNNAAIFLSTSGILARKGDVAAGTANAKWASFDSIAVSEGAIAFLGKLVVSSSAGVSESSDQGLWIYDRDTGVTSLMIREGDVLLGSKVKVIGALATRTKAGGQGRGVMTSSSEDQIALRITLTNGKTALGVVSSPGGVSFPYQSGMPTVGFGTGALWSFFGLPGQNSPSGALCFLGTVKAGTGTATATNNIALFSEDDTTLALTKRYGLKDGAGIAGGVFSGFSDPVNGSGGKLAFIGSMANNSAAGITSTSNDGVWYDNGSVLTLVAREGAQPPGVVTGARWKSFNTVALPEGRGPIFVATLEVGRAGITTGKDKGVWATDSAGAVKKLIQEGDPIGASKVASFQVLTTVSGSPAQARSFNRSGDVVIQVTDAAGGTHLVHVVVP